MNLASQFSSGKIVRPRLVNLHPRRDCQKVLDGFSQKPLVWISGPAGGGKTTLAAHYLENRSGPCLWIRLDEGQSDPADFFYYLGLACQKAQNQPLASLPLLTPEYFPGLFTFAQRFFEAVYQALAPPLTVALDNFQTISPISPVYKILAKAASDAPVGVQFFILSRNRPPPPFSRLKTMGKMGILGWDALQFSLEEVQGLAAANGREISGETASRLWKKTQGWAAGLKVILEGTKSRPISLALIDEVAKEELFDYYLAEVLDQTDESTRIFLKKTAILPFVTPEIARELTQEPRAENILDWLRRHHFFTVKSASMEGAYQYHNLFKNFLLDRLEKNTNAETIHRLRQTAAGLLKDRGFTEEALDLHIQAQNWEAAAKSAVSLAPDLLAQGRNVQLLGWLRAVRPHIHDGFPEILYFTGACLLPMDPAQGREYFIQAFEGWEQAGDAAGMLKAWAGIMGAVFLERNDFSKMDRWVAWMDRFLGEDFSRIPRNLCQWWRRPW